jgi:hypothetical protein
MITLSIPAQTNGRHAVNTVGSETLAVDFILLLFLIWFSLAILLCPALATQLAHSGRSLSSWTING